MVVWLTVENDFSFGQVDMGEKEPYAGAGKGG